MPCVSIIVPVYNAAKSIRRCAESVLQQEYKDFELILVNDGSKDDSPAILDALAAQDERVKVIHQENAGASAARNHGIEAASGKYLQFMDADDWLSSDATKLMVRTAEDNQCDMVIADFYRVVGENLSRKGNILTSKVLSRREYAEFMMDAPADYYYGVLWNKLYRRDLIETYRIRMDEDVSFCEDFLFNLEYVIHCERICALQVPVYYYVKTEGSLVASNLNLMKLVEMKTSIFQYYNNFFKSVLDPETYEAERLRIAGFLIDAARDDMTIPMMPGTMKIGEETVQASYHAKTADTLTVWYYTDKLYQRYLNAAAMKYDLTLSDLRIYTAICMAGGWCTQKEIADFTGIGQLNVMTSFQKLQSRHLIGIRTAPATLEVIAIRGINEQFERDVQMAKEDMLEVCLDGFSQEEKNTLDQLVKRICVNARNALGQTEEKTSEEETERQ